MSNLIITKELLDQLDACDFGDTFFEPNGLYGKTEDECLRAMKDAGRLEEVIWWRDIKKTETFVRNTGSVMTMGAYQVFNPLTGIHTRYETEEEARQVLIAIAKEVLNKHCPRIVQELANENGDTTWIPTNIHETLQIS